MKRYINAGPMPYWSRREAMVLLVAMLAAMALLLTFVSFVGGQPVAALAEKPFTIHVMPCTGGTITPSGDVSVKPGGQARFTIAPASGFATADVRVDGKSFGAVKSYTFINVRKNHSLEATFKSLPAPKYAIRTEAGTGGSITPGGTVMVAEGASQRFEILPAKGFKIEKVFANGRNWGPMTSFTFDNVRRDSDIRATFQSLPKPKYAIRTNAGTGGTISPSGTVMVIDGESQTFAIAPAAGYRVEKVTAGGTDWGPSTSYTFTNVRRDGEIKATFIRDVTPQFWTITAHSEPAGMGLIIPKGSVKVKDGESVTFEFVPKTGFRVQYATVDTRPPVYDSRYTFTNVRENHTIVVHFVKKKS